MGEVMLLDHHFLVDLQEGGRESRAYEREGS